MPFFDPDAPLTIHHGKLPHWRQECVIYFVTFRLADSLPQAKLDWLRHKKELWIRLNPGPHNARQQEEFHQRYTETIDRWLNAGWGSCILACPDCKAIMESSLRHFDGERYELGEFIVMPNHVHAIVATNGGYPLTAILHTWKSFTAHQFNRLLNSSGRVWCPESFDHIVRSPEQLAKFRAYIRNNGKRRK